MKIVTRFMIKLTILFVAILPSIFIITMISFLRLKNWAFEDKKQKPTEYEIDQDMCDFFMNEVKEVWKKNSIFKDF